MLGRACCAARGVCVCVCVVRGPTQAVFRECSRKRRVSPWIEQKKIAHVGLIRKSKGCFVSHESLDSFLHGAATGGAAWCEVEVAVVVVMNSMSARR